jgi:hypothetical protein
MVETLYNRVSARSKNQFTWPLQSSLNVTFNPSGGRLFHPFAKGLEPEKNALAVFAGNIKKG